MKNISRKEAIRQGFLLASAAVLGSQLRSYGSPAGTASMIPKNQGAGWEPAARGRADWMAGKWGMMVHWIAPVPRAEKGKRIEDLDQAVDQFDVAGL